MHKLEQEFIPKNLNFPENLEGKITKKSPSNIALIKYWGKYKNQIPANPSLSFTLNRCYTETTLIYKRKEKSTNFSLYFYFEKKRNIFFEKKILSFFEFIFPFCTYLKKFHFEIFSKNTFPHSSGIASSASSMSALARCLIELENQIGYDLDKKNSFKRASFLARLGSGSACRSIYSGLVVWGTHPKIKESSDFYAIKYPYEVHSHFKSFEDTILIIEKNQKSISSSKGHELMKNHPFAKSRFRQANENLSALISILKEGDLEKFGKLIESEALSLHAMMMSSNPYYLLMKPSTLRVIEKIWTYRKESSHNLYFTLDAGANIHLLYPKHEKEKIFDFISNELIQYCQNGAFIRDFIHASF